jgi:NADH-quinone oxidoreductase subunit N
MISNYQPLYPYLLLVALALAVALLGTYRPVQRAAVCDWLTALGAQEVADATGSDSISALCGLHRRSPSLAFAALIILFSLGGIPPLAGLVGKLYLFAAAWQGGQQELVFVGALTSVIALYYYLMVARQVYIADPADPTDDRRMTVARPLGLAISLCVIGTLVIGIYPRPFIALGEKAAASLHTATQVLGKHSEAPEPLP